MAVSTYRRPLPKKKEDGGPYTAMYLELNFPLPVQSINVAISISSFLTVCSGFA